jgi:hypothetical protein
VPAIVENTTPNQSAPTADALAKAWLVGALDRAIEPLLCEVGCAGLTAEVIARRFRVAKGSARLTREAVDEAVWRTLDEWERQLPARADGVRDEPMAESAVRCWRRLAGPVWSARRLRAVWVRALVRTVGLNVGGGLPSRMDLAAGRSPNCWARRFRRWRVRIRSDDCLLPGRPPRRSRGSWTCSARGEGPDPTG